MRNKLFLLLVLFIIGCTDVAIVNQVKETTEDAVDTTKEIIKHANISTANTETNISDSVIEKIESIIPKPSNSTTTKPNYDLPTITIEKALADTDVDGFGDII